MNIIKVTTRDDLTVMKAEPDFLKGLQKIVGGFIEIVHPKNLPHPFCMVVDDEGRINNKPINKIGSLLYGYPTTTRHPIVGDVAFVKTVDLPDGDKDIGGLSDTEASTIMDLIAKERKRWQAELLGVVLSKQ